ncbi:hypothetical protein K1T71_004336 [Dendrolimus kikuchii]|uniref:Uncharacterized protein n=1 Tax=Dendrolimus kikuchii TaxID=765133 RepID=A0ACC1D7C1_9NEOP|nr:hypothetical protein K1T71_004336 [Dendrolimus kikuchii]
MSNTSEILEQLEELKCNVAASLQEISELDICNKTFLQAYLNDYSKINPSSIIFIQAVIDYMYEKVNIGNWKEVKPFLRKTITIASYLKLLIYLHDKKVFTNSVVQECFKIIDYGILFGSPLDKEPKLLQKCAGILQSIHIHRSDDSTNKIKLETNVVDLQEIKYNVIPLEVLDCPSMEYFYKNFILKELPVVLDKCINHWPALKKWQDPNYLLEIAGMRTISIEIGNKYTDADWTQKLMTLKEFITEHIYKSNTSTGYLAQYQLFDQVPELRNDVTEPEYCCFSDSDDPTDIMAWFGPKGTVSPLHHDPKKNLLAQVIGEKQIFLYAPTDSEYLYPHEHELMNNTARVDPREPDLTLYPKYASAKAYYCLLKPGQLLFIPPKWWHFVESLSVSFSVSFWWE